MNVQDISVEHGVAPGMHRVLMPLPFRTEPVNCWVLEDGLRVWIVDTGLNINARELWTEAFRQLDIRPEDVAGIVITHFHPDHIGASGVLAAMSGAPVYASDVTIEQTPGVWGVRARTYHEQVAQHLIHHGMPESRVRELDADMPHMELAVQTAPLQPLPDHQLTIGDRTWQIIPTPGHADGHVSLFDAQSATLIAGDHLLERISPAVGQFPDHAANPLAAYVASLKRIAALNVQHVLPGHGAPFTEATARCRALQIHHEQRLAACEAALADGATTTWEVARRVFGDELDSASERFAVTETLAHLVWGASLGRVQPALAAPEALGAWQVSLR